MRRVSRDDAKQASDVLANWQPLSSPALSQGALCGRKQARSGKGFRQGPASCLDRWAGEVGGRQTAYHWLAARGWLHAEAPVGAPAGLQALDQPGPGMALASRGGACRGL